MRRLVGIVFAASALLGALVVAAPAAAETAQQCHATLNQYRAKAGLDKASSSSIPALGVAAAKHAAVPGQQSTLATPFVLKDLGLPDWACRPDRRRIWRRRP